MSKPVTSAAATSSVGGGVGGGNIMGQQYPPARLALGRLPADPSNLGAPVGQGPPPGTPVTTSMQRQDAVNVTAKASYPFKLDFSSDMFKLTSDAFLSGCQNVLKTLDLRRNNLVEVTTALSHLSKLKVLRVDGNSILSFSFKGLISVEFISARDNKLSTLSDMTDLKKIVSLDFAHNQLSSGFEEIGKLKTLRVLDLSFNRMDFSLHDFFELVMKPLKKITKLEYLAFEGNPCESHIPDFKYYVLSELPKLKYYNWVALSREDHARAEKMDSEGRWQAKLQATRPVATTSDKAATQQNKRLTTRLDELLSDIDQFEMSADPEMTAALNAAKQAQQNSMAQADPLKDIDEFFKTIGDAPTTTRPSAVPQSPSQVSELDAMLANIELEAKQTEKTSTDTLDKLMEQIGHTPATSSSSLSSGADLDELLEEMISTETKKEVKPSGHLKPPPNNTLRREVHKTLTELEASLTVGISPPDVPPPSSIPPPSTTANIPPPQVTDIPPPNSDIPPPQSNVPKQTRKPPPQRRNLAPTRGHREPQKADAISAEDLDSALDTLLGADLKTSTSSTTTPEPKPVTNFASLLTSENLDDLLACVEQEITQPPQQSPSEQVIPPPALEPQQIIEPPPQLEPQVVQVDTKPQPTPQPQHPSQPEVPPTSEQITLPQSLRPEPVPVPEPQPELEPEPQVEQDTAGKQDDLDMLLAEVESQMTTSASPPLTLTPQTAPTQYPELPSTTLPAQSSPAPVPIQPAAPVNPHLAKIVDLEFKGKLGDGAFGDTYRGTCKGAEGVLKKVRPQRFHSAFLADFVSESMKLVKLKHENIVSVAAYCTDEVVCFVTPFIEGQNLFNWSRNANNKEDILTRVNIAKALASGMHYLHENGVVHGSLKSSDIILNKSNMPLIRDYGYNKIKSGNLTDTVHYSPEYYPPELFASARFSQEGDVYSYGIILWEMFESGFPHGKPAPQDQKALELTFTRTPPVFTQLIKRCTMDPGMRPSFSDLFTVMEATPMSELTRVIDTADVEQAKKIKIIVGKMIEMMKLPSDLVPVKALRAVQNYVENHNSVAELLKEGILPPMLDCLSSPYEQVVEAALAAFIDLCRHKAFTDSLQTCGSLAQIVSLYSHSNDTLVISALKLSFILVKNKILAENLVSVGCLDHLIEKLHIPNDLIVVTTLRLCTKLLKFPAMQEKFLDSNQVPWLCSNIGARANPVVRVLAFQALAFLSSHSTVSAILLQRGFPDHVLNLLSEKSELLHVVGSKCAAVMTKNEEIIFKLGVTEWTIALILLLKSPNPKIIKNTFQAFSNFCKFVEGTAERLHPHGIMKSVTSALSSPTSPPSLLVSALALLKCLFTCDKYKLALSDLIKVFPGLITHDSMKVSQAALEALQILASDASGMEEIKATELIPTVILQLCKMDSTSFGHSTSKPEVFSYTVDLVKLVRAFAEGGGDKAGLALCTFLASAENRQALIQAGGLQPLLMLMSPVQQSQEALPDALLRAVSAICKEPGVAPLLFNSGAIPCLLDNFKSGSQVLKSNALKLMLILCQSPQNIVQLKRFQTIQVLEEFAEMTTLPPFKAATQKILTNLRQ
ncbi:Serine/threonine-protein kinase STY17 [Pelomyxa schiedti]|nr:Serine/threonine-protein kinase STY17 [Pelomyxa schiedti]